MSNQWIPEVGDRVRGLGQTFQVRSRAKDGDGQVWLFDQPAKRGMKYRLEDCQPESDDRALDEVELKTVLDMIKVSVLHGQTLELVQTLECFSEAQKRQVWSELTPEMKQALIEARRSTQEIAA
jgi:hypothetical protein